jgi:F-type H+-transporting ATPase subunit b
VVEIDWLTAGAQVINFLILVWLLKRYLYGPVIKAMDAREARIAARLRDAEESQHNAAERAEKLSQERKELAEQREQLIENAHAEARAERARLVESARQEIQQNRAAWIEALDRDKDELIADLRAKALEGVNDVVRATLSDVARADLEPQVIAVFIERLAQLGESERQRFVQAASTRGNEVMITTAHDLPLELRDKVRHAIRALVSGDTEIRFARDPAMALGVRATAGSQTVTWNIDSYLDDFQDRVANELTAIRAGKGR